MKMKIEEQSNSLVILENRENDSKSNLLSPKHNVSANLVKISRKKSYASNTSKNGNYRSGRNESKKPLGSKNLNEKGMKNV